MQMFLTIAFFALSFFTLAFFALMITSLFKFHSVVSYILSIYLLSFSCIVLVSEIASVFDLLNNKYFFLLLQMILLGCVFLFWKKQESPDLFRPLRKYFKKVGLSEINVSIKNHLTLYILGFFVFLFYSFGAYLVLRVPPNNYDSLTCHMTRIGFWLQNGNLQSWPTWVVTQRIYPFNAQLQILWSVLFWGSDQFAGFAQWIAALIAMIAIYGIARLIGWSQAQSLFASFIFSLFPEILLESTTTQNHLITASLLLCAFYFLFAGFRDKSKPNLLLSSIALGVALGTHQLAFFILPGLAITVLLLWLKIGKTVSRYVLFFSLTSLLAFGLLGSIKYMMNNSTYDSPFYDLSAMSTWVNNAENYWTPRNVLEWTKNNLERYMHTSLDLTGLPPVISTPIFEIREKISAFIFDLTDNPKVQGNFSIYTRNMGVHEDLAWFGIVGFLLFYPLMIAQGIKGIKKKDPIVMGIISTILLYAVIWAGVYLKNRFWSLYAGRYFIVVAMIFAPFISSVYNAKKLISRLVCGFLVLISIFIAFFVTLFNPAKPLVSDWSIWKTTRLEKVYSNSKSQLPIIQSVNEIVPTDANLGIMLVKEMFDYPFFGEHFERKLYPIYPESLLSDATYFVQNGINWVLICKPSAPEPAGFTEIKTITVDSNLTTECRLYQRNDQ